MNLYELRQGLERDIKTNDFIRLYLRIRQRHKALERFTTPQDLVQFLHEQKFQDHQAKDRILQILITEYQQREDQTLSSYLLLILLPGLTHLFYQFRGRVKAVGLDVQELWGEIGWLFFQVLKGYETETRPTRTASTIIGRVKNRLRDWCHKVQREREALSIYGQEVLTQKGLFQSESQDLKLKELVQILLDNEVISKTDLFIILGSRVYGEDLKRLSHTLPFSYESTRKRRQRAEKAIREFLQERMKEYARERGCPVERIALSEVLGWMKKD